MTKGIGLSDVQIGERREVENLKERIAKLEELIIEGGKHNLELEKRLATEHELAKEFAGGYKDAIKRQREAEKREAVLREALEPILKHGHTVGMKHCPQTIKSDGTLDLDDTPVQVDGYLHMKSCLFAKARAASEAK